MLKQSAKQGGTTSYHSHAEGTFTFEYIPTKDQEVPQTKDLEQIVCDTLTHAEFDYYVRFTQGAAEISMRLECYGNLGDLRVELEKLIQVLCSATRAICIGSMIRTGEEPFDIELFCPEQTRSTPKVPSYRAKSITFENGMTTRLT